MPPIMPGVTPSAGPIPGMPGAAPGGMPGMPGAPTNVGPVAARQPQMGNAAASISDVRAAMKMLEKALPTIPMGTDLHVEVLNSLKGLLKHLPPEEDTPALNIQSLLQMARQSAQAQPLSALTRLMGAGAGPAAAPAMPLPASDDGAAA